MQQAVEGKKKQNFIQDLTVSSKFKVGQKHRSKSEPLATQHLAVEIAVHWGKGKQEERGEATRRVFYVNVKERKMKLLLSTEREDKGMWC